MPRSAWRVSGRSWTPFKSRGGLDPKLRAGFASASRSCSWRSRRSWRRSSPWCVHGVPAARRSGGVSGQRAQPSQRRGLEKSASWGRGRKKAAKRRLEKKGEDHQSPPPEDEPLSEDELPLSKDDDDDEPHEEEEPPPRSKDDGDAEGDGVLSHEEAAGAGDE